MIKGMMERIKKLPVKQKVILTAILLLLCFAVLAATALGSRQEEPVYREAQAVRGRLTVGVTETGSISIGTSEQTLDIDISEYTATSSSFSEGGMGRSEGMGGMMQAFPNATALTQGTVSTGGDTRSLQVEEVYVSAGQEVEKGMPILKLTDESVSSIRQKLEEDASSARLTYEQLAANQKLIDQQARAELDINKAYGRYADGEYQKTVNGLNASVEEQQEQLADTEKQLEEQRMALSELEATLAEYREVLANAEYARDYTDREENLYGWVTAVNTVNDSKDIIEALEEEIEAAKAEIENLEESISSLNTQLALANKELRAGEIDAEAKKSQRQYQYDNAQEIYDVTVGKSNFEAENAKEDYEEAKAKLEDFDSVIVDGVISSQYSGVVTSTGISVGESLEQDAVMMTLNDYGEATVTVTVDEEDMEAAAVGKEVNIFLNAFPDEIFRGKVAEIGDAEINSNTNTTVYSVTVSVADDAERLYEGMTAEVTFITEETAEVLYVPNRALEDGYVKVRDSRGRVVRQKVATGFTDGVYTEIQEGLSEGDTVLIEGGAN